MKRLNIILLSVSVLAVIIVVLVLHFLFVSSNAIELRDAHESLKSGEKQEFSYAFAKGDTIMLRMQVTGGTLSEFTVVSLPDQEKYKLNDFNEKVEKEIVVDKTNCFTFSLYSKPGCQLNYTISRVPGVNAPKKYDTEVNWADDTEKEKEYVEFVNLTEQPEFILLCPSSGKYNPFSGCNKDRVTRTYDLPEDTKYWIYRLEVDNSKVDTDIKESENIYKQLNSSSLLPNEAKLTGDVLNYLTTPSSSGYACDLYFLASPIDAQIFEKHKTPWNFDHNLSKENTQSICERIINSPATKRLYIGMRNNNDWKTLKVQLQITAAVLKKEKIIKKPIFQTFE